MQKQIFGFDLGVTSIGWSVIKESDSALSIVDLGARIIPLTTEDKK